MWLEWIEFEFDWNGVMSVELAKLIYIFIFRIPFVDGLIDVCAFMNFIFQIFKQDWNRFDEFIRY